jgi:signal transduction histidine kinase
VLGDAMRLEQVLQNLLHNAIKYSPEGGAIVLAVGQEAGTAYLRVTDQGIGIPAEALPHLFGRFYRAANVDALAISGLGIGLHVVQQIVVLHGGEIDIESREGVGSTFTVRLPCVQPPPS